MNERVERARAALRAHDVGVALLSSPHNVCYASGYEVPLQPGMVLALEPAAYVPGIGGVRSEHVILITDGGAEVLSSFAHGI